MLGTMEARNLRSVMLENFPDMEMTVKPRRMVMKSVNASYYFMTNKHGYRLTFTRFVREHWEIIREYASVDAFYRKGGNLCVKSDSLKTLVSIVKKCELV